jgi:hypothetical protein
VLKALQKFRNGFSHGSLFRSRRRRLLIVRAREHGGHLPPSGVLFHTRRIEVFNSSLRPLGSAIQTAAFTEVWSKQSGQWRMRHGHYSTSRPTAK